MYVNIKSILKLQITKTYSA